MPFLAAVEALLSLESMKFPVFSLVTGNFRLSETGFARDCLLQRRVQCEPDFRDEHPSTPVGRAPIWASPITIVDALPLFARRSGSIRFRGRLALSHTVRYRALKDAEDETRKALEELCHPADRGSNPSALTRSLSAVIPAPFHLPCKPVRPQVQPRNLSTP